MDYEPYRTNDVATIHWNMRTYDVSDNWSAKSYLGGVTHNDVERVKGNSSGK